MRRNVKHGESARWQVPFVTRRKKVGSTGMRCHRFELWEVAWNNCGERGDFLKLRQLIPRTTTDFHYKMGDENEMEGVSQYMAFQQRLGV